MRDEKRLARLRASVSSVSPDELAGVLNDWGFELQSVHGSHHVYRHRGCYTSGDTPAEALENLDEEMAAWIESCLRAGDPIPEPGRAIALIA